MTDLPEAVAEGIASTAGRVARVDPVGGGCIAHASRIRTDRGVFFLKWSGGEAGGTFEAEAAGLQALHAAASPLLIPDVLAARNASRDEPGYLLLEWIEPGSRVDGQALGEGLAALHAHVEPKGRYGFERDNFIGRLPQRNAWHDHWPSFFREARLAPQFEMARQRGRWRPAWDRLAVTLLTRLDELLPESPPAAIVHGDLWSGNVMATASGRPALVDPAAYYGHAETDLAMMSLFGGFDASVFGAYFAAMPREPGYEERLAAYQLYHVVNHLNHFGEGYAGHAEALLRRLEG